ncbi:hypothetical protein JXA70_09695 [candidate division KSB1 bacterium]|nr:hypothetical protein [candidate division KSB1 bacterium]
MKSILILLSLTVLLVAQKNPVRVGNVFPHLTVHADGIGSISETGIGALIPWANKLWAVGYVAHIQGSNIGLYEIDEDMTWRLHPESVTGTFANRLVHWESGQAIIGPHLIDPDGLVRTIPEMAKYRLAATMRHLFDPENKVYFLTMEGFLWEVDVNSLESKQLFDLNIELDFPEGRPPHFKGGFTAQGRVVVAANRYWEEDFLGTVQGGRLAEWDGESWTILEKFPFVEVSGKQNPRTGKAYGNTLYATGWSKSSVILRVLHAGQWKRYLLPKASHSFDHAWNTEWMRIREVQTERYLMDVHGMFYDLPALVYDGWVWGIRPVCTHLRIIPDFVFWRGLFVLAGDQTDNAVGQPQSGLWFGNIDDLWSFGKPGGWGGPWWEEPIDAGEFSDPFLLTGFDKKVVHLAHNSTDSVTFTIQVDFLGNGTWKHYTSITVSPETGYAHHEFTDGFSAHWVRVKVNRDCVGSVYFIYH